MRSENRPSSVLAIQKAHRLLKDANVTANASKKLVHRVRSKLQSPRSDVTIATIVDHVDSIDARSVDVLQALLQVLESQVSAEKFQAVHHRVLVIAARRGHEEILRCLNDESVNNDYSHGEALETAVFRGHVSCVKILLTRSPSIPSIERALLTTDYIDLSQAQAILFSLLDFRLPRSLLDYLILKILAASRDDQDIEILNMLIEAANRGDSGEVVGIETDSSSLYAYFDIQKQIRTSLTHQRTSSSSSTISTRSIQRSVLRKPYRNMFGDETIQSPDNVIIKLLVRFLTNCVTTAGNKVQWSLQTLDLLLERLPSGAEELAEYGQSLCLAASFEQSTIYTRLLHHRPSLSQLTNLRHVQTVVKSVEITGALVEFLKAHYSPGHEQCRVLIERLFAYACQTQLFPVAIRICLQSHIPVSISPVRESVKGAIESEMHIEEVAKLLKVCKVEESDLDALWECVLVPINFPSRTAQILLKAGCKSLVVARTFLRCVRFNEELSTLVMILEEWKITNKTAVREEFDYNTKMPVATCQSGISKTEFHYYSTLATAMSIAIDRQQCDLCQLLVDKGAPLIVDGRSLLETAVRRGSVQYSLEQDKVLTLIIDAERQRAGTQVVLDYALLQAVKHERAQLATDLINQGASTTAYKYEVWRVVFDSKDEAMLCSLLTTPHSAFELSKSFMAIFASFSIDPKTWITLCDQLHRAGYVNPKCYSWVLSVLCLCNKATALSAERLLSYGASACDELDQSLEQCWLHGNLLVFRVLIGNGVSQHAAEALFRSMTKDIMDLTNFSESAGKDVCYAPKSAIVLETMDLLLQQDLPKRLKDTALCSIAVSYRRPASQRIPVLRRLIDKGARFSEDDGLALLNCLLIDDKELTDQINNIRPPLKARQLAIHFALHFPNDMGEPAPSQRFNALAQLLYPLPSTTSITLSDQQVMDITGIFLSPNSETPTTLIHHFYGWLRNRTPSGLSDLEHCWTVEKMLNTIFEGLAGCKDQQVQFIERITAVLAWTRPEPDSAIASARYFNYFWLPRKSLSRYLVEASTAGLTPVVGALLEAGISPNVFDEGERSALFWATSKNEPTVVLLLMDAGADLNDGSLHEAMCQQHQAIMKLLLKAGHDRMWNSSLHEDSTPLLSFIQFDHNMSEVSKFPVTVNILMTGRQFTTNFCRDLKSAVEAAITRQHAFQLILALLPWLRKSFDVHREIFESPIARGPLRYSLLSLIDRWEVNYLNRSQRNSLVLSLQGIGFEEAFYTVQGDQPGNAVNVPAAIVLAEEARKRRVAFETKECCIHGDKAESENEIHAGLMPTCAATHGWKGEIVCTDCLKQYLESRMFPHDDVTIKYKFPATKIPCWAPKCPSTELSYNVLREHTDPEIFHLYDLALCQALLREGKSMVKCATQDCPGAHWYDEHDLDEDLKIFFCDICYQNTCTECNDHYEKHDGLPCPAGEDARKSERIREEEKLSEEALKLEKKCPKCNLMYQKYTGCDHIVCGKNVYDNKVDKGCRFEFCDVCFGAWPNGHTRRCVHRM